MKPRVFIGSSKECLHVAEAIQANIEHDSDSTIWTQGIFQLSQSNMENLEASLSRFDFAVFVFGPDDILHSRERKYSTVRDNVLFEMGLFIGRLGRNKVYYVIPRSIEYFKIPSDLVGYEPGTYADDRSDNNWQAAVGPFCSTIKSELFEYKKRVYKCLEYESERARIIAAKQEGIWQFVLLHELLNTKFEKIRKEYNTLKNEYIYTPSTYVYFRDIPDITQPFFRDSINCLGALNRLFSEAIPKAVESESPVESITEVCNHIVANCNKLFQWEYKFKSIMTDDDLLDSYMQELSESTLSTIGPILSAIDDLNVQIQKIILEESTELRLNIKFNDNPKMQGTVNDIGRRIIHLSSEE